MTRIAHCCCGSLRAEVTGEPALAAACHCIECQRRTGSSFGVTTWFAREQVRTEGPSKVYVRGSDSGRKVEFHFCPDCGSTVYMYVETVPALVGIAFGAFADPSMPSPTLSAWETTRHPWVTFGHELQHFERQPELGTIGELVAQGLRLSIYCDVRECHHNQTPDLETLSRELGPDYRVADFVARSHCSKCGAKWPQLSVRVSPIHTGVGLR
jgi:hypothetical protein